MNSVPSPSGGPRHPVPETDPVRPAADLAALHRAVEFALDPAQRTRLSGELTAIKTDPAALHRLFPTAGRRYGRGPLPEGGPPGWSVEDGVRTRWLTAAALRGEPLAREVTLLYRHGDAAEKRGVLRALPYLPVGDLLLEITEDALRTNDPRLVGAALGPYAGRHLDQSAWRQAVLKCLFTGLPLTVVAALEERADAELARLAAGLAAERRAAGRPVPDEVSRLAG